MEYWDVGFYTPVMIIKLNKREPRSRTQKSGLAILRGVGMNDRDQTIIEIANSFFDDLRHLDKDTCFEFDNPEYLKNLATFFIAQKAKDLSDEELLTAFGDSRQLLDEWLEFLKTRLERLGKTTH